MRAARPAVGAPVRVLMTKWPDRPHSAFAGAYLGADAWGDWVGALRGTTCRRGGSTYPARSDWVTLLPGPDAWWRAGFYHHPDPAAPLHPTRTYVDVATPTVWEGDGVATCVDLDLDVVERTDGAVVVDDEDEFAQRRAAYPADVVAAAEAATAWVHAALTAGAAPFDGRHRDRLAALRRHHRP
ncbi:hypothetical protein GCM10023340_16290 [Nocardioides marinquilinus]|uniref:DUF402 domain-containing protein n=1 Tax=Nocardioides marinquilinus TaxID=1210400 RepID=A0ABP9PMC9_9ACTN